MKLKCSFFDAGKFYLLPIFLWLILDVIRFEAFDEFYTSMVLLKELFVRELAFYQQ